MSRPLRAVAAALTTIVLLAGCGSSALSTAQLRTRAARICNAALARESRIPTPTSTAEAAAFIRHGIAALEPELRELRLLDADGKAASVSRRALDTLAGELSLLHAAGSALARNADPVQTMQILQTRLQPLENSADDAWTALEIPACLTE